MSEPQTHSDLPAESPGVDPSRSRDRARNAERSLLRRRLADALRGLDGLDVQPAVIVPTPTQIRSVPSRGPRRSWQLRFAGGFGGAMVALLLGITAAFAFFATTDSSNTFTAVAAAGSVPEGATPQTPTTTAPNSSKVTLTFAQATLSSGGVAITDYQVTRYPDAGGAGTQATVSCSSSAGTTTCTENSVPDGTWQYTDTPLLTGTHWTGAESSKSPAVTVDTTPPVVSVTFPADGATYNADGWSAGGTVPCGASGTICGQAADATSGISGAAAITLTITQSSTGKTWDGTAFAGGSNTVNPTTYSSGSGSWTYTFGAGRFPTEGTYSVAAVATDRAGNASPASTHTFVVDITAPAPAVTSPADGSYIHDTTPSITGRQEQRLQTAATAPMPPR